MVERGEKKISEASFHPFLYCYEHKLSLFTAMDILLTKDTKTMNFLYSPSSISVCLNVCSRDF